MGFDKVIKDILSFGADRRIRKRQADFDDVCRQRHMAIEALERSRDAANIKVKHLVKTKTQAVQSLFLIGSLSKNLETKPRFFTESEVLVPSIEEVDQIDRFIGIQEIGNNAVRGLTAGTSTALGTWALVGAYGTASTGTAIGSLSGAAASNAILAWLGWGSIAAGGGGVATGTIVLGGVALVPAALITGILNHVAAGRKIKEIEEQEVRVLSDIKQCKESELVLEAFARRVEEVDVSIAKARGTFEIEFARAYHSLFRYGLFSKLVRHVRRLFGGNYFREADLVVISPLLRMAHALACLIDQKLLDESGNII